MNIKVVVIWGFAILVLGGLGLFGYLNQDALVEIPNNDAYVPKGNEDEITKSCNSTTDSYESNYKFVMDSNNQIKRVNMSYKTKVEYLDGYEAASNLSNSLSDKTYISAMYSGGISDFQINLNVDITSLVESELVDYNSNLTDLNLFVKKISDYNEYVTYIKSNAPSTYACE